MRDNRPGERPLLRVLARAAFLSLLLAGCATPLPPAARVAVEAYPPAQQARVRENLAVFQRVWGLVDRNHFDAKLQGVDWRAAAIRFGPQAAATPDELALYRVLNDMLGELHDSHTHALRPDQAEERRTLQRARTGFNLQRIDGRWVVSEVLPGSPAEAAGIKPGWIVVSRNGEPLAGTLDFRMKIGDEWQWEFLDEKDRRIVLSPKAQLLSIAPRQVARELEGGIVYLRFDGFDATDRRWLSRQLKRHVKAPGVIIDLRRNSGGDTFSLGTTIGEFFDRSVDCGTFISRSGARDVQHSWQIGSAHYAGKVAILIDAATASAAEIFSAVLQDQRRAVVIGRTSAGAVLASWFYSLPDGGELQLSRYDYVAPKGRRIEATGVKPDIEIAVTLGDVRSGRDRDIEAAVRALRETSTAASGRP